MIGNGGTLSQDYRTEHAKNLRQATTGSFTLKGKRSSCEAAWRPSGDLLASGNSAGRSRTTAHLWTGSSGRGLAGRPGSHLRSLFFVEKSDRAPGSMARPRTFAGFLTNVVRLRTGFFLQSSSLATETR